MSIKDMGEIFKRPLLKELSARLENAQKNTDPMLDKIHASQNLVRIHEINWDYKRCYIQPKMKDHSQPWIKNMVKSLLMEYYGSRALHLQIVVQTSQGR